MVSKPNPEADEQMRYNLHRSYVEQLPLWNHPGDFNVPSLQAGCFNCNSAFKLGSAMGYATNAYSSPEQFFYVPFKTISRGGRKPRHRHHPEYRDEYISPKQTEEISDDWWSLVKELVPLGVALGDIVKIFYNKYSGKYGSGLLDKMMGVIDARDFMQDAHDLGKRQYY